MFQDKNHSIESAFFEFRKMKTFLESNVTLNIPEIRLIPINIAQEYVNSLILIDLVSVFDKAVEHFFNVYKLAQEKHKSKFQILEERDHLYDPRSMEWYRSWRHETAHQWVRHESYKIEQAIRDMSHQLKLWGIIAAGMDYYRHQMTDEGGKVKIAVRANEVTILEYEVWSSRPNSGTSRKTIDLSWADFTGH